jgi:hypothetical protein
LVSIIPNDFCFLKTLKNVKTRGKKRVEKERKIKKRRRKERNSYSSINSTMEKE